MRKKRAPYKGTDKRRRQIIDAALYCFNEHGFPDTTMEDVRKRSGASNGSIYHHFNSKEQLAAAIYLEGILDYQQVMLEALNEQTDARAGIFALVGTHLRWVADNVPWAGYLFTMRKEKFMSQTEGAIEEANNEFATALALFFRRHVKQGTLRKLPKELYFPLLFGPCQEYARHFLMKPTDVDPGKISQEIASAAWRALRPD